MEAKNCWFHPKETKLLTKHQRWREVAKSLKLSKNARNRLEWIIYYEEKAQGNASLTCRYFGISRKTFHKWYSLFNETNLKTLEDRSKAPLNHRKAEYTYTEVVRMQRLRNDYPALGRHKLIPIYLEEYGVPIRPQAARRIVTDYGLYAKRAVRSRKKYPKCGHIKKRITDLKLEPFTGFVIEADTIVEYFNNEKRYILTAIDYHSRFAFAYMYKTKASKNAADFLRRITLLYGGNIEHIHIDNGSEFKKEFEMAASELGIELLHARPYQPKDKPLIERFNGTLQQEFIDLGNFTLDVEEFNRSLLDYIIFYNFKRPHWSLGLKRPIEYVTLKTEQTNTRKVLPMYSPITFS
ncbi:MAG: DDE-type integrase/transposase/recombinase [Patescibacteria group bacterium]|nr:DDE-type integrase/transposase/recombinase [Patescibacteria group bacterium]